MTLNSHSNLTAPCFNKAANDPSFSNIRLVRLALVVDSLKQPTQANHSQETTRGYTGHERIDAVGIIHMNGRIYDPKLARCLQADPIVQAPTNTQSQSAKLRQTRAPTSEPVLPWARRSPPLIVVPMSKVSNAAQGNTGRLDCARLPELGTHYSYVWNNPLNNTDPSGYAVFSLIVGVAIASSAASLGTTALIVSSFVGMTLAGTMDALMAGASIGQALRSGFISGVSAAAFAGIGRVFANGASTAASSSSATARMVGHITAHAAVGGITEVARGGKFGHGFLSAGITKGVFLNYNGYEPGSNTEDMFNRLALHAVVGGTSSKISGGKFANGAKTASFQFLFNEWASKAYPKGGCTGSASYWSGSCTPKKESVTVDEMTPIDLLEHFGGTVLSNGDGGSLYFGPDSKMSQLFSQGEGAKYFESKLYEKYGGTLTNGSQMDDFGYKFNSSRFLGTSNLAEHVVGSWGGGQARVVNQQILFRVRNSMGVSSFFAGRYTEKWVGWSIGPKASDVHMTIEWTSQVKD